MAIIMLHWRRGSTFGAKFSLEMPLPEAKFCVCSGSATYILIYPTSFFFYLTGTHFYVRTLFHLSGWSYSYAYGTLLKKFEPECSRSTDSFLL